MVILYHHRPGGLWARAAVVAAGLVRPGSGGCRVLVQLRPIQNQPTRNRSGAERAYDWIAFATGAGLRSAHKIRLMASVPARRHCCGGRAGMAGRYGGQGLQLVLRGDAGQRARWGTSGSGCAGLPSAFTSASLPGRTRSSITVVIVTSPSLPSRVPDRWAGVSRQLGRQGDRGR